MKIKIYSIILIIFSTLLTFKNVSAADDVMAVYRFYSPQNKAHFFTISQSEKERIIATYTNQEWRYEGIAYYVSNISPPPNHGPEISIGLHEYTREELEENSFRITSEENYLIKDENGATLAEASANSQTRIKYLNDSDHTFRIYNSVDPEITTTDEVYFEISDGDGIFDIERPEMTFSEYRGKIKLRYSNNNSVKRIWVINELPLEQYIWGMGEITGTGPMEYNKVMTTAYRTYGYWKILYSTAYAVEGFKLNATPGNQLYHGYEWEENYPRIKQAAQATRGKIAKHGDDVALTPYSSWTDGRTRSFEEHWGSTLYPWCQSVSDPYGDYNGSYWSNSYKSTSQLVSEGNHMVGISAHGALSLANDENWDWDRILKYYLDGISITSIY